MDNLQTKLKQLLNEKIEEFKDKIYVEKVAPSILECADDPDCDCGCEEESEVDELEEEISPEELKKRIEARRKANGTNKMSPEEYHAHLMKRVKNRRKANGTNKMSPEEYHAHLMKRFENRKSLKESTDRVTYLRKEIKEWQAYLRDLEYSDAIGTAAKMNEADRAIANLKRELHQLTGLKEDIDCDDDIDVFLNEETGELYYIELNEETLEEAKIITRVNFKGRKRRVLKCPPGRVAKLVNGRRVCVTQTGQAKIKKRLAVRKANRTKRSKGAGYKRRVNFKRNRAMIKRRQMGLSPRVKRHK